MISRRDVERKEKGTSTSAHDELSSERATTTQIP